MTVGDELKQVGTWLVKDPDLALDALFGEVVTREEEKWGMNKHIHYDLFAEIDQARTAADFFTEGKLPKTCSVFKEMGKEIHVDEILDDPEVRKPEKCEESNTFPVNLFSFLNLLLDLVGLF